MPTSQVCKGANPKGVLLMVKFFILTGVERLFLQRTVNAHNFKRQPGSCQAPSLQTPLFESKMHKRQTLGGGFKHFLFLSLLGEIIQFD